MIHIFSIIQEIAVATGSKSKIEVLEGLSEDETALLKRVVKAALDPNLSYFITSIDEYTSRNLFTDPVASTFTLDNGIDFLAQLSEKGSASNTDREELGKIKSGMNGTDAAVMDMIVDRNLRCGCKLTTFRKVWGADFLPEIGGMKCSPYSEETVAKHIKFPAAGQTKSDGARCFGIQNYADGGKTVLKTFNGRTYHGLGHIIRQIDAMAKGSPVVFDGELVVKRDGKVLPRAIGNGIINKSVKGTITPNEAKNVHFVAWDLIDYDVYFQGAESPMYIQRMNELADYLYHGGKPELITHIHYQHTEIIYNLTEARRMYVKMRKAGEEGIILKNLESPWVSGRPKHQVKFKAEVDVELEIIGTYAGKKNSKYADMIGGLTVRSSCGKLQSNVGSGMTDELRGADPESLIGQIVEIKYNERTVISGQEYDFSLYLPRLVEVRLDKNTANSLEEIIAIEKSLLEDD